MLKCPWRPRLVVASRVSFNLGRREEVIAQVTSKTLALSVLVVLSLATCGEMDSTGPESLRAAILSPGQVDAVRVGPRAPGYVIRMF